MNEDFLKWLATQDIDTTSYAGFNNLEQNGLAQSFANLPANEDGGFLKSLGFGGSLSDLTGLAGLGMKAFALPGQMDAFGAQTDLLKQQVASNKQSSKDRKAFNNVWANASNSLAGSGVA